MRDRGGDRPPLIGRPGTEAASEIPDRRTTDVSRVDTVRDGGRMRM
jgi:hypothetical protein